MKLNILRRSSLQLLVNEQQSYITEQLLLPGIWEASTQYDLPTTTARSTFIKLWSSHCRTGILSRWLQAKIALKVFHVNMRHCHAAHLCWLAFLYLCVKLQGPPASSLRYSRQSSSWRGQISMKQKCLCDLIVLQFPRGSQSKEGIHLKHRVKCGSFAFLKVLTKQ